MRYLLSVVILIAFCALVFGAFSLPAAAGTTDAIRNQLDKAGQGGWGRSISGTYDLTNHPLLTTVGTVINVLLGLLGAIAVVLFVYGGSLYLTAMGDPGKTKKAKSILTDTVLAIAILLAAYAIANFVVGQLAGAIV